MFLLQQMFIKLSYAFYSILHNAHTPQLPIYKHNAIFVTNNNIGLFQKCNLKFKYVRDINETQWCQEAQTEKIIFFLEKIVFFNVW